MRAIIGLLGVCISAIRLTVGLGRAVYQQKAISVFKQSLVGKDFCNIDMRVVKVSHKPLVNIDLWFHYLRGDLDLVGPKALLVDEAISVREVTPNRFKIAPGLITPYQIKSLSGIAHKQEIDISEEFAKYATSMRRFQLLCVWLVQRLFTSGMMRLELPTRVNLFGVNINNVTMSEAVDQIVDSVRHGPSTESPVQYSFVNADCANRYIADSKYRRVLDNSQYVFPDGVGIRIAARLLGKKIKNNVNGTDLFPLLCQRLATEQRKVFLYGATNDVVSKLANKLPDDFKGLEVVGYHDGYSDCDKPLDICQQINKSGAEVLLVALGAPRQEKWIAEHRKELSVSVAIGVGGLFDFYSGSVARAPEWMREFSLEWVWRLMMQPRDKAVRYLIGNPLFLIRAIAAAIALKTENHNWRTS